MTEQRMKSKPKRGRIRLWTQHDMVKGAALEQAAEDRKGYSGMTPETCSTKLIHLFTYKKSHNSYTTFHIL